MTFGFSARPVQIATAQQASESTADLFFASTRPVQIATSAEKRNGTSRAFASTRPVQIATRHRGHAVRTGALCLHTLRADCNGNARANGVAISALPPHAPCRLQHNVTMILPLSQPFASTRSVQIATPALYTAIVKAFLCLHTLRADCNLIPPETLDLSQPLPPHAPCRLQLVTLQ